MMLRDVTYLAHGKRGVVSSARMGGRAVVIKERNPRSRTDTLAKEAQLLRTLNAHGIGPRLVAHEPGRIVLEHIKGVPVEQWIASASASRVRTMLRELFDQCRTLDTLGISKYELHHPHKHIIVRRGHPVQIDFERAHYVLRPKNVTQLCQWITREDLCAMLRKNGIVIDRAELQMRAKRYKETYAQDAYELLREAFA